jgi:hypothetical protein
MSHEANGNGIPFRWKAVTVQEWLQPEHIHQRGSRIDRNPDFYNRCRRLLERMRRATAENLDSLITPVNYNVSENDDCQEGVWASYFYSGVSRWLLLTNHPERAVARDQIALAVCLGLPGFDTDQETAWRPSTNYEWASSQTLAPNRLAWVQHKAPVSGEESGLWIRVVFVRMARPWETFLCGSIYNEDSDDPHEPNLVATNPDRFEPGWLTRMSNGFLSWTDEQRFLLFLNEWLNVRSKPETPATG